MEQIMNKHKNLTEYIDEVIDFLREYQPLFNLNHYDDDHKIVSKERVVHFFVNNHWKRRVPKEWADWFDSLLQYIQDNDDELLFCEYLVLMQAYNVEAILHPSDERLAKFSQNMPSSLISFIGKCSALRLRQDEVLVSTEEHREFYHQNPQPQQDLPLGLMSLKKKHEIELLGEHIIRVVHDTHCNVVVDLGCGKGYLTNYVQTRDQELTVIGIEGNKRYAESFEKRFEQLESKKSAQVIKKARLINAFIPLDISEEDFIKSLGDLPSNPRIVLIGLHTCGDLAPAMLSLYGRMKSVKAIVSVGCCYHKLSENPLLPKYFDNPTPLMQNNDNDKAEVVSNLSLSSSECKEINSESKSKVLSYGFPLSNYLRKVKPIDFHLDSAKFLSANILPEYQTPSAYYHMAKSQSMRAAFELMVEMELGEDRWKKRIFHVSLYTSSPF